MTSTRSRSLLPRTFLCLTALCVTALLGAACTQTVEDGSPENESTEDGAASTSSDNGSSDNGSGGSSTATSDAATQRYESPIDDFVGYNIDPTAPENVANLLAQHIEGEQRLVECMSEAGFEYHPAQQASVTPSNQDRGLAWDSLAFAETFGFGVSTRLFPQSAVGDDLVGHTYDAALVVEAAIDLNDDYIQSLDEENEAAYYATLYGTDDNSDSCQSAVETDEDSDNNAYGRPQFQEEFGELLGAIEIQLAIDPRTLAAREATQACLSDAGYPIEDLDGIEAHFFELASPIQQDVWNVDPFAGLETETMTDDELDALQLAAETPSAEHLDNLAEVQATETATAVALFECNGGSRVESEAVRELRYEFERDFLATHADALSPYKRSSN